MFAANVKKTGRSARGAVFLAVQPVAAYFLEAPSGHRGGSSHSQGDPAFSKRVRTADSEAVRLEAIMANVTVKPPTEPPLAQPHV